MPLITLDDACLAFGHVALLDKAAFQLDPGERVALIGRNGSGKSSLLKALAGQATLDDGRLWRQPGAKVAYVPQEADFPLERSVFATQVISYVLCWVVAAVTLISGVKYLWDNRHFINTAK